MTTRERRTGPTLVRWGPVVAGAVIGIALMLLLSAFWVALAEGTEVTAIADNLHWYGLISAVVSLLVAGFVAGWLSGTRGVGAGFFHGVTVWALVLVGAIVFTLPQAFQVFEVFNTPAQELGSGPLWATFWSLLAGLVVAAIGGIIGGGMPRPEWLYSVKEAEGEAYGDREGPEYERRPGDGRAGDGRAGDGRAGARAAEPRVEETRRRERSQRY